MQSHGRGTAAGPRDSSWRAVLARVPRVNLGKWDRPARLGITVGLLVVPAWRLWRSINDAVSMSELGVDQHNYFVAALRWFNGGTFYLEHQLTGPYIPTGEPLYPPVTLWLLVPFAHLPAFLWWAVPSVLFGYALYRLGPHGWWVPAAVGVFAVSKTIDAWWLGGPTIWIPAFLALGLWRGGWAVLVLLKPSLFPFALAGIGRRAWWLTAGVLALISLPFGAMWLDWLRVVQNSGSNLLYSADQVPMMLVPVIAWLGGRSRRAAQPAAVPLDGDRD